MDKRSGFRIVGEAFLKSLTIFMCKTALFLLLFV